MSVCADCGAELRGRQQKFCSPLCRKRYWRATSPGARERERVAARDWKARNHERVLAYNRDHGVHPCADCGASVTRHGVRCFPCEKRVKQEGRREIQRRWQAGQTLREIAAALDSSVNSVGVTIVNMRNDGWDMPYRRTPEQVARIRAGTERARAAA